MLMTSQTFKRFATAAQITPPPIPMKRETPKQKSERRKGLEDIMKVWKLKIGFEFHVQIKTKHKMFSCKVSIS